MLEGSTGAHPSRRATRNGRTRTSSAGPTRAPVPALAGGGVGRKQSCLFTAVVGLLMPPG